MKIREDKLDEFWNGNYPKIWEAVYQTFKERLMRELAENTPRSMSPEDWQRIYRALNHIIYEGPSGMPWWETNEYKETRDAVEAALRSAAKAGEAT